MRGHFRSREKDGGHTIQSTIPENPVLHVNLMALCFAGIGIFDLFCSYNFDLDQMALIYELDPYSLEIHRMCKYALPTARLSKVIV